jgi:NitT/TauT family transport system substrate-binding protein
MLLMSCAYDDQPAVRIGGNIWPGYEPMYIANAIGEYDSKQIHLIDFPSAVEVARAYRNGVIDVAALTADEALVIAASEPGQHKIILIADYSSGADCILAQPSFTTLSQLKGRRIGVESNALGAYVLLRALQLHDMSLADVQPVSLSLDQHVAAFGEGAVDAVVTFEPSCANLLASGAQTVFTSKEIPGEVVAVIVTRTKLIDTRRPALLHFVRGWFAGVAHMQRDPQDAARRSAIHEHTSPDAFLGSLQGIKLLDRKSNLRLFSHRDDGIDAALTKLAATLRAHKLLITEVDVRGLTDGALVEQASP